MKIANNITELVGKTPLVKLNRLVNPETDAEVLVKLESFNPGSSVKDRIALAMVKDAEEKGLLKEGSVICEPTSGNTGIGIAMVAAQRGYKVVFTMPSSMSVERRKILKAFGAELVLTEPALAMQGAIDRAKELEAEHGYVILQQFENMANPEVHAKTTALEIIEQTDGNFDCFVSGVGTGGTVSGCGKVFKEHNSDIKIVAIEPTGSPVISGGVKGPHKIQGIGAGFIPNTFDKDIFDELEQVENEVAFEYARRLPKEEGIFAGISSGAAVSVAVKKAKELGKGKRIVVVLPDTGERYLSMEGLFEE